MTKITSPESSIDDPNPAPRPYILGRGKVEVDGRYIGNTPYAGFAFMRGKYFFRFGTEYITPENILMFFRIDRANRTMINYIPANPFGPQIGFQIIGFLRAREFDLKSENWQTLDFEMEIQKAPGTNFPDVVSIIRSGDNA